MLNEKTILISAAETKQMSNGGYMTKIKDEQGLTYTVFHTKKDGADTQAYAVLRLLANNGLGLQKNIVFDEKEMTTPQGQPYTARTISGIKEPAPVSPPQQNTAPNTIIPSKMPPAPIVAPQNSQQNKIAEDIRGNVALKGAIELVAAGKVELKDWLVCADEFYSYKPTDLKNPLGLSPEEEAKQLSDAQPQAGQETHPQYAPANDEIKIGNIPFN